MSSTQSQLVEIDPAGDLIINVVEYDQHSISGNGEHPVKEIQGFKVSRRTLLETPCNDYWKTLLEGSYKEAGQNEVTLHDDTVASMELWLRVFHGKFIEDSYTIKVAEIWHAIEVSRKYLFHLEKLEVWFKGYWEKVDKKSFDVLNLRQYLFPCQALCHSIAFAYVTRRLAHEEVGHVQEFNPTQHRRLHLEGRVLQQLNAAKGSMRKEIIAALFDPLDDFCEHVCEGADKATKAYINGVRRTGIWPLKKQNTKSNKVIMDSDGIIDWKCEIPQSACSICQRRLDDRHIVKLQKAISNYWQGLCLDCMDISSRDLDTEYWNHNEPGEWDKGCTLYHQRNTWYFSFMGRPSIMETHQREQRERKRAREVCESEVADIERGLFKKRRFA